MKLGRKPDPLFITLLERSAQFGVDAAGALVAFFSAELTKDSFADLDDIEHRADANTHDLLLWLEKGSTPPLPEPVTRQIALGLDEIVDAAEGAAELAILSGVTHATDYARDMAAVLVKATHEVVSLVSYIGSGAGGYRPYVQRIHEYEGEGDDVWEAAYGSLFSGAHDPLDAIRWKDIYASLEAAIDQCEITAKQIERALGRE